MAVNICVITYKVPLKQKNEEDVNSNGSSNDNIHCVR